MRPCRFAIFCFAVAPLFAAAPALVAAEAPVALENLVLDLGPAVYRIPRLEAAGTSLSAADAARLFDRGDPAPLAERLARLSAARVTIPELVGETKAGGVTQRLVYRDVIIENLVAGRAATLRAAALEQTAERAGGPRMEARYGAMTVKGADFKQIIHVVADARADEKEIPKPVEEEALVENAVFAIPDAKLEIRVGRASASNVKARALLDPLPRLFERLPAPGAGASAQEGTAAALALLDALGAVEIGAIEMRDVALAGVAMPVNKPYSIKFARAALEKFAGSVAGDAVIEGFEMTAADGGAIKARRLAVKGFDPRPMIQNAERPAPRLDRIELSDIEGDLPDAKTSDFSRVKFKAALASADFANYREGLPAKISARLDHLAIDLAARGETPATAQFLALGYRDVDLSVALDAEWRETEQEFALAKLRIDSKDMGALSLAATLGGVSSAVFSTNFIVSKAGALAASVKRVEATVESGGLIARLLEAQAKAEGAGLEKLRADYARDLEAAISALLGGGEKGRLIGAAAGRHVADPRPLCITLTAPGGVNALDLLAKRPAEILEETQIDIGEGERAGTSR